MNTFKELQAPCLVCKQVRPGTAFGITPTQAVCFKCYGERPAEVEAAFGLADRVDRQAELELAEAHLEGLKIQEVEIKESIKLALARIKEIKAQIGEA